jgi:DNA-binding beta-propeller fold protein YncE
MKVQKSACRAAAALLLGGSLVTMAAANGQALPLKLVKTIPLPGFTGDFDHFAVDSDRGRLLLAAEDHKTLEVFDLKTLAHLKSVGGFAAPHSILVRPGANTILVADGFAGMSKLLDAKSYDKKGLVTLVPGADSLAYDPTSKRVYIVTGGKDVELATSEIAAVDPESGKKLGAITTQSNHTEAVTLEQNGQRLFVNLTDHSSVEVIDRNTMKKTAEWPLKLAKQASPIAFDEGAHRLFLGCREPGMLVVMNSDTGQETASLPGPLRADDMPYDAASHRLYMLGGEGYIAVYDVSNPDHPKLVRKVTSAPGAKTGILLPGMHKLVVAASPGDSKAMAKILVYDLQS